MSLYVFHSNINSIVQHSSIKKQNCYPNDGDRGTVRKTFQANKWTLWGECSQRLSMRSITNIKSQYSVIVRS